MKWVYFSPPRRFNFFLASKIVVRLTVFYSAAVPLVLLGLLVLLLVGPSACLVSTVAEIHRLFVGSTIYIVRLS